MQKQRLKLKQASAVLQIEPKELQNLVQFGVVKPKRFEGTYFFDTNTLMVAKVAFCLKESLGTRTSVLSKLMDVFLASEKEFKSDNPKYIVFKCRLSAEEDPIKVGVPFRALGEQLQEQMIRAELYRDLPRGRKRRGWKKEFLESLTEAAKEIGEVSDQEILKRLRVRSTLIGAVINLIHERAETVNVHASFEISPDPKDDPFCLCSEEGNADFIVTLNPKDFPQERLRAKVISPEAMA